MQRGRSMSLLAVGPAERIVYLHCITIRFEHTLHRRGILI